MCLPQPLPDTRPAHKSSIQGLFQSTANKSHFICRRTGSDTNGQEESQARGKFCAGQPLAPPPPLVAAAVVVETAGLSASVKVSGSSLTFSETLTVVGLFFSSSINVRVSLLSQFSAFCLGGLLLLGFQAIQKECRR